MDPKGLGESTKTQTPRAQGCAGKVLLAGKKTHQGQGQGKKGQSKSRMVEVGPVPDKPTAPWRMPENKSEKKSEHEEVEVVDDDEEQDDQWGQWNQTWWTDYYSKHVNEEEKEPVCGSYHAPGTCSRARASVRAHRIYWPCQ